MASKKKLPPAIIMPRVVVLMTEGIGKLTEVLCVKELRSLFGDGQVDVLRNGNDVENFEEQGNTAHFAVAFFADGMNGKLSMLGHEFFDLKPIRKMVKFLVVPNSVRVASLEHENFSIDHVIRIQPDNEESIFSSVRRVIGNPMLYFSDSKVLDLSNFSAEAVATVAENRGSAYGHGEMTAWANQLPDGADGATHSKMRRERRLASSKEPQVIY